MGLGDFDEVEGGPIDGMAVVFAGLELSLHTVQGLTGWVTVQVEFVKPFHESLFGIVKLTDLGQKPTVFQAN